MSNQSEDKGSSFPGIVAGAAAGGGAGYYLYGREANAVVQAARTGELLKGKEGKALEAAEATVKAAEAGVKEAGVQAQHASINALKNSENVAGMTSATFTKASDGKGFTGLFTGEKGTAQIKGIKALPKDVKLEGNAIKLEGEALKKITEGDKSWVSKTAAKAEVGVNKAVGNSKAFKEVGGAFKNMSIGGKGKVVGLTVLASAVAAVGANTLFGKHSSKVSQESQMEPSAGRA